MFRNKIFKKHQIHPDDFQKYPAMHSPIWKYTFTRPRIHFSLLVKNKGIWLNRTLFATQLEHGFQNEATLANLCFEIQTKNYLFWSGYENAAKENVCGFTVNYIYLKIPPCAYISVKAAKKVRLWTCWYRVVVRNHISATTWMIIA